jgi:hypothetical protein
VAEALATLKAAGAKAVLTLPPATELAALKVTDLAERGTDKAQILYSIKQIRPHALSLLPQIDYFNALAGA